MIRFVRAVDGLYKRKALGFDTAYVSHWHSECLLELQRPPQPLENAV